MSDYLVKPIVALLAKLHERLGTRLEEKGIHLDNGYNPVLDPENWNPAPETMDEWRARHRDDN